MTCSPFAGPVLFLAEPPDHAQVARIEASGALFVPTTWEALVVEADAVVGLEQDHIAYSFGFTPLKVDWTNKKLTAVAIRHLDAGEKPEDVEAPPAGNGAEAIEEIDAGAPP